MSSSTYSHLRYLLTQKPSEECWLQILHCLMLFRGRDAELATSYVEEHLKDWEPSLKKACFVLQPVGQYSTTQLVYKPTISPRSPSQYPGGLWLQIGREALHQPVEGLHPCWRLVRSLKMVVATFQAPKLRMDGIERLHKDTKALKRFSIQLFCQSGMFSRLQCLDLSRFDLDFDSFLELTSHPFKNLLYFNISWNPLGQKALKAMMKSPSFQKLRSLHITGTAMNENAAVLLNQQKHLPSLSFLEFSGNEVSRDLAWSIIHTPRARTHVKLALLDYLSTRDLLRCARLWDFPDLSHLRRKELLHQMKGQIWMKTLQKPAYPTTKRCA